MTMGATAEVRLSSVWVSTRYLRVIRAVFCGDILHQAIQIFHPEWNSIGCADQVNARRSRRLVLERCAGSGALLMPTHFGAPFVCHVDAKSDTFVPRWA
jgi:hypothetical protein